MEYIRSISIIESVIHVLDTNSDEPILNEYRLELNEELYKFILKHVERALKDEELKYAKYNEERSIVREVCNEYLSAQCDILQASSELARQMFKIIKSNSNISSCDLMVVAFSTEYGPMLGIFKMDYIKNYTHKIDFLENKMNINIIPQFNGLPISTQRIQKCAFIKLYDAENTYDLLVIDKKRASKDDEDYGSNYFLNTYLGCNIITNDRDMTKEFVKATETWTRSNLTDEAHEAERLRSTIKKKLKENDEIDVRALSEELFEQNDTKASEFKQFISAQGLDNEFKLDKEWVDKKLKRIRLKIDKEIDLYIDSEVYQDPSRFEITRNGDGSINMTIKHVMNYIEK